MLREKVTKLAKIMFTGLTMALCVTVVNPAVTAKADMLQESEPNDNLATANQLPLNTWMRGIMEADNYETDWYRFTIQQNSQTSIELIANDLNRNSFWYIKLYDSKRRELCSWENARTLTSKTLGWAPGEYYLRIYHTSNWGSGWESCSYDLMIHNTPTNLWEKERYYGDKNLSNCNIVSLNKAYSGCLYCSYDVDYYRLKLKGTNGISFKFVMDETVTDPGRWKVEFFEYKSRNLLESYRISTNETLTVPRCSGDLLVKISNDSYASGDIYHFQAASRPSATQITSLKGGTHSANLRWKKVSNATGYYIYRKEMGSEYYTKVANVKGKTSYTDKKSLKKSGYYYYKIVAYRKSGSKTLKSAASNERYTYIY